MIAAVIAALTVIADQLTKYWAVSALGQGGKIDIIKGVFSFVYTSNYGAAFGILQNQRWLFLIITLPAIALMAYLIWWKKPVRWMNISLALILGGAVGNLIDRVALTYVRDFIYFEPVNFPLFNVADSAVTVGAVILAIVLLFGKGKMFTAAKKKKDGEKVDE